MGRMTRKPVAEGEESFAPQPSLAVIHAWARLVRVSQHLLQAIERELKSKGLPPLSWYDVLLELGRATEGRLRPAQIEKEILLAQYNLSRLLDRLEAQGLVGREVHDGDARGQWVVITDKGRTLQKRMWQTYGAAIQAHVGTRLDDGEATALAALLGKLKS